MIKFSPHPGAYERRLQRKYNNPLFPQDEQLPDEEQLQQARIKDQQDLGAFMENFQETLKQAAGLLATVDSEVVLDLKEKLERLYVSSASLAQDMNQIQEALLKLLNVCMMTVRQGAADDPMALGKLAEEEQARQIYFSLLQTPLVADLMRGDEIISEADLIPAMLSETEEGLKNVMDLFEPEQLGALLQPMRDFVASLPDEIKTSTAVNERLAQFEQTLKKLTN